MKNLAFEYEQRITKVHALGAVLVENPEPVQVALKVEEHRWYWRPPNPRLILIAESHVYTSPEDFSARIDYSQMRGVFEPNALPPEEYVGLIYCLGYGEPSLLTNGHSSLRNRRTVGFWDVFGRLTGSDCPRLTRGHTVSERICWKLHTLQTMKAAGIWLLDASVHAIYRGGGERVSFDAKVQLHQQWWGHYGRQVLDEAPNASVCIVGKTVFDVLRNLPGWRGNNWIYQPNARAVDKERGWSELIRILGC